MKRTVSIVVICMLVLLGQTPAAPRASAVVDAASKPLDWIQVASMPTPRYGASIATTSSETIYVMGGNN